MSKKHKDNTASLKSKKDEDLTNTHEEDENLNSDAMNNENASNKESNCNHECNDNQEEDTTLYDDSSKEKE